MQIYLAHFVIWTFWLVFISQTNDSIYNILNRNERDTIHLSCNWNLIYIMRSKATTKAFVQHSNAETRNEFVSQYTSNYVYAKGVKKMKTRPKSINSIARYGIADLYKSNDRLLFVRLLCSVRRHQMEFFENEISKFELMKRCDADYRDANTDWEQVCVFVCCECAECKQRTFSIYGFMSHATNILLIRWTTFRFDALQSNYNAAINRLSFLFSHWTIAHYTVLFQIFSQLLLKKKIGLSLRAAQFEIHRESIELLH